MITGYLTGATKATNFHAKCTPVAHKVSQRQEKRRKQWVNNFFTKYGVWPTTFQMLAAEQRNFSGV